MGLIGRFSSFVYFAIPVVVAVLTWLATYVIYRDPWGKLSRPMFLRSALAAVALFFPASLVYYPAGPFLLTAAITTYVGFSSRRRTVIAAGVVVAVLSAAQGSQVLQLFLVPAADEGAAALGEIVALERTSALLTGGILLIAGVMLIWLEHRAKRSVESR
ncbi:hypothetical protein GSU68_01425 [Rathayibacter sp. VKM Ac-2759]|uniref:hypothetical protein n=1 Tax=Rathayibacter sp. VKM Ac-2759 TaxID=2609252 RepID=UPI0013179567|nr:hypothetical protein [Rathayibacter sp. VKM Ac-2759]QHC65369.1 hypothetical protein GSU68_01425 [Rathayibacter sp. VKM Ac-2759]